jgi:uncharacterized phage protein gp47/JayE
MTDWGLSSTGFFRPRLPAIVTELEARWRSRFGANRSTIARTIDGKLIRFAAECLALSFEGAEGAYQANFLDTSSGAALDLWAAGKGFIRNGARASVVTLTLGGTPATAIPAGSIVLQTSTARRWVTDAEGIIDGGGTVDVVATAEETGPFIATSGSDWEIVTPVTGWNTTTNALDATLGQNEETDAEFRQRIRAALRAGGLKASLLRLENVELVTIFQNDTEVPDATYGAIKWVEALVVGGDDQEIIDTIWREKAPGIGTQGDSTGFESGPDANEVRFSRGAELDVWVTVTITAGENFVGDETEIRDGIVLWANGDHAYGDDVAPDMIAAQVPQFSQGRYSVVVEVGTSNPPSSTAILSVPDREIARFDTSRTVVVIA